MTSSSTGRGGGASSPSSYAAVTSRTAASADASSRAWISARTSPSSTARPACGGRRRRRHGRSCRPSRGAPRRGGVRRCRPGSHRGERSTPSAAAVTSRTIGACSSADSSAVPPCASIQRRPDGVGRAVGDGGLGTRSALLHVDPEIGEGEQPRAAVEHELGEVRRALAAYGGARLAHLERVADGCSERLIHVGQQADDLAPCLAPRARASSRRAAARRRSSS